MAEAQCAKSEERDRDGRSLVSTLPGDSVRSAALHAEQPAWCVDLGHTLVAMTLYEVWLAFAQDQLTPETKVWREGMPWWEPIAHVPEFALAMPDSKGPLSMPPRSFGRSPVAVSMSEAPIAAFEEVEEIEEPFELVRASALPAPPRVPVIEARRTTPAAAPVIETATPAPVVVEPATPAPRSGSRRRILPSIDRRGALSVAAGAALAILALAVATTGPASGRANEAAPRAAAMGAPAALWEQASVVSSGAAAPVRTGVTPVSNAGAPSHGGVTSGATVGGTGQSPEGARPAEGARAASAGSGRHARPWERGQQRAR